MYMHVCVCVFMYMHVCVHVHEFADLCIMHATLLIKPSNRAILVKGEEGEGEEEGGGGGEEGRRKGRRGEERKEWRDRSRK